MLLDLFFALCDHLIRHGRSRDTFPSRGRGTAEWWWMRCFEKDILTR